MQLIPNSNHCTEKDFCNSSYITLSDLLNKRALSSSSRFLITDNQYFAYTGLFMLNYSYGFQIRKKFFYSYD